MIDMKKQLTVIILIVIGLAIVGIAISNFPTETKITSVQNTSAQTETKSQLPSQSQLQTVSKTITINIPAVDDQGNGVITKLKVQALSGEGRTLVNVDNLLFWVDTQFSIRTAKEVAQNITQINLSNVDLIYDIETNASVIEGESAGAALTIATVAAIQNKTVNQSVIITGTINPNGDIGPIGGVIAKAKAAKDVGAALFLVPEGQSIQVNYIPERKCEKIGPITYCTTDYKQETIDISKDIGIDVEEVSNIQEALKYFISD